MHVYEEVLDGVIILVPLGSVSARHLFLNFLEFIYDLPDRLLIHRPHDPVLVGRRGPVVRIGHLHQSNLTLQVPLQVYLSLVKLCKVLV